MALPIRATLLSCCWLFVLAGAAAGDARAQAVTLYRCTDTAGNLTIQSRPCPPGTTQREQPVAEVPTSPEAAARVAGTTTPPPPQGLGPATGPGAPMPGAPHPSVDAGTAGSAQGSRAGGFVTTHVGPEPRILDSADLVREAPAADAPALPPPPPLFQCVRREGDRYLSEQAEPEPRCVPLRTVGLDGNPATGAGSACEVIRDQCAPVPAEGACEAWRRHAREAEARWRFAHPDNVEWRRAEYERRRAIVVQGCGD
ncbi:DUF4124 domain-containing protein [Pseudoxanthomonas sp. J35]|uniref:DUF4124 domain-containing protein n=1 Tax=Pseudoxanthomonas sp. J35 TaxID=935852 RepID=UPI0004BC3170|nr:DUF4124 domain-containing protein [Pseudoxanthomonas sp. J35]